MPNLHRDNSGNPTVWGDIAGVYTRAYGYDKNSRLDSVTYPGHPVEGLAYDWVGNRGLPGSSYNAADQLVSRNGHAYQYDGSGNITQDNDKVYAYTPDGLLQSLTIVYLNNYMAWDAAGNRVGFSSPSAGSYSFVYDPTAGIPAVVKEVTPGGPVYYIREPGGGLICRKEGATTQYYHFDDLGSTLFLTGSDGAITDKYRYDAWGKVTHDTGTTNQPYQYVGRMGYYTHYQAPNMAGLLQLGVRFYDPETGRFTQRDPLGDTSNSYGYAGSNPVSNIDPAGLTYWDAKYAFERYGANIASVAKEYGIQPELLGGVVYAEQYAGGWPALWNEVGSEAFFLIGAPAGTGVTQFTLYPGQIDSCDTYHGRATYLRDYLHDPNTQLRNAAQMLKELARRRYGNDFGRLKHIEMGIVLTEYNKGRTNTPNYLAMPSERYGRLALSAMPDIRKWLGLRPIK